MDNDLASDGGINVDNDVLGCEIEMKSDRTIVKPLSDWPVFTFQTFSPQCSSNNLKHGYNAAAGTYKDLMSAGIIDPTKKTWFWSRNGNSSMPGRLHRPDPQIQVPPPLNPTLDIPIAASDVPDKLITENDVSYLAQLTEIKPVFYDESSSLTKDEESESETKRPGRCA
ncbi:hypothetical protein Bca52824_083564 [Brassica carinata]|uniref:Uncharacterized protein n=1 Tax=Brassica carinata TaxID=52824 RepID=A0A8X7PML1_BRACI|nr:hypothetical protein Bca52824_083564 [Brassica carinata]